MEQKRDNNKGVINLKGEINEKSIWIDDLLLTPERSFMYRRHCPDGFHWGYNGSGPAQLALAILLEVVDREKAVEHYQAFKINILARIKQSTFEAEINVQGFIMDLEAEDVKGNYIISCKYF